MILYIIYCGSFQCSSRYRTREEAQQAANFRTYCTGTKWEVKEIIIP